MADKCPTITASAGMSGNNQPVVVGFDSYNLAMTGDVGRCLATPSGGLNEHIPVVVLETFHCVASEDITAPLKARDYKDPLVVLDRAAYNQGENAKYDFEAKVGGVSPPVIARGPGAICYKEQTNGR